MLGENITRRILLSFALIMVFVLGTQFILLGLDSRHLAIATEQNPFLRLVNFVGGGACGRGSIFTVSVLFIVLAESVMALMITFVPFYNKLFQDAARVGVYGSSKRRLERDTAFLGLFVALLFTIILTRSLIKSVVVSPSVIDFVKAGFFYFVGSVALLGITILINKLGIINGLLAIMVSGFVMSLIRWFIRIGREASQVSVPWGWVFTIAIVPAAVVASILLGGYVIKVPISDISRARQGKKIYGGVQPHIPIAPISPFSTTLLTGKSKYLQTILLFAVACVFDLLLILSDRYEGSFGKILVGLIAPIVVAALFHLTRFFIKPDPWDDFAARMRQQGTSIPGLQRQQTAIYLRRVDAKVFLLESLFCIGGLLIVQMVNLLSFLPVHIHPLAFVSIWPLVELIKDTLLIVQGQRIRRRSPKGFLR